MNLLFVDCCISQRGEASRTKALCQAYLDSWQTAHPEGTITRLDLSALDIMPFDVPMLNERDNLFQAEQFDHPIYALARQFAAADHIVVGAPFWDLTFPAVLRIYIEHVSANGVTYYYDEQGPHGSCAAQTLVFLTSGGDFAQPDSNGVAYWKQLCSMYGIARYDFVFAGGLDAVPEQAGSLLSAACQHAAALGRA